MSLVWKKYFFNEKANHLTNMCSHGKLKFGYPSDNSHHSKRIKFNTTKSFECLLKVGHGVSLI